MKKPATDYSRGSNIVSAIRAAHDAVEAAQKSAVKHAAECGRLLLAAKETVPHGQWALWVADNCTFSMRTAQLYMKLSDYLSDGDVEKAQRVALLSLREVGTFLAESRRTPEDNDMELKKKEWLDAMMNHWLTGGPLERRAFLTLLALQKAVPLDAAMRKLRWLARNDGDGTSAAIPELENPGLQIDELLKRTPFDRQPLIERAEAESLFEVAGRPAATLAVIMADKGHFASPA